MRLRQFISFGLVSAYQPGCFRLNKSAVGTDVGKPESNFELLTKVLKFETHPHVMSLEVCKDPDGRLSSLQILIAQAEDDYLFLQKIGGTQHICYNLELEDQDFITTFKVWYDTLNGVNAIEVDTQAG